MDHISVPETLKSTHLQGITHDEFSEFPGAYCLRFANNWGVIVGGTSNQLRLGTIDELKGGGGTTANSTR